LKTMDYLQQLQQMGLGGGAPRSNALIEIKAGKMNYDGRMVTPDRRKGLLRIVSDAHGMKTFQWCDAETKTPIDSFYVFPDEAKFEKVKQSKDRVYLLEMKATMQRHFYWFQDDEKEKDAENCTKIHNILNNINNNNASTNTAPVQTTSTGSGPSTSQQRVSNSNSTTTGQPRLNLNNNAQVNQQS